MRGGSYGADGTSSLDARSSQQHEKAATDGETDADMVVDESRITTDPDDKEYAVVTAGDTKVKSARKRRRNKEKEENKNLAAAASEGKAIEFDARSLRQVASLYRMNEKRAKNMGHAPSALPGDFQRRHGQD